LLRFQIGEIASANLRPDEEAHVEQDYRRASNAARLLELAQAAQRLLHEDEPSLLSQAGALGRALAELQRLDPAAKPLVHGHDQASNALRELHDTLSRYTDRIDLDPARLSQLEERLNLIHALKRKYGTTLSDVLAFAETARRKLHSLEQREAEWARLNAATAQVEAELWQCGQALSRQRRQVIPELSKAVVRQLRDLGFRQSDFAVDLQTAPSLAALPQLPSSGLDTIEFQFAPNPGEPARPLRAIASSGELARVMLALKTVLAAEDEIPVLIFDEVDANVGGETASAVGEKMRQIARQRQVLCVTHLPQVAAQAHAHHVVIKQVKAGRTTTDIARLEGDARVTELARMLGGQSAAARQHAAALLKHEA
jgi:DNA repair protein RecN (Recombination protein N)